MLIYRHPDAPPAALREVCAGAEEEGVPTVVAPLGEAPAGSAAPAGGDATALAHAAALASRLDVGIGLDAGGVAVVHHGKLPARSPAATTGPCAAPPDWRRAGRTAARVVKGLPLV